MGMIGEFKQFIARGNVMDFAIAVVIGAAFGRVITALVDGIVMPAVGMLLGGIDLSDWKYVLKPARFDPAGKELGAEVAVKYGAFLQTALDFVLVAFVIFLVVKAYNRMKKPDEVVIATSEDTMLLREIRDSLKK